MYKLKFKLECANPADGTMLISRRNNFDGLSNIYSSSRSIGLVEIASLCGLCFFHLCFGKDMIQAGTSQPDAAITLAMFRKYGTSASVYNAIASPLLPALPERPIIPHTKKLGSILKTLTKHENMANKECQLMKNISGPSPSPILWMYDAAESGKS